MIPRVVRTRPYDRPPMPNLPMHPDEIDVSTALVQRLVATQFPRWASLALERFPSTGTECAIFRLGPELAVRMPLRQAAVAPVEKEWHWLPLLAPHLPLPTPVPLEVGAPAEGYPWRWSVIPWLPGENATLEAIGRSHEAARQLAGFIHALQRLDPSGGPTPGPDNFYRGAPLADRDPTLRARIAAIEALGPAEQVDLRAATAAWEAACAAPRWDREPVWLHGDLLPGNLLVENGRLSAVIDFEALAVGDPACELMAAWAIFAPDVRGTFRSALEVDDATWERGRGWALWQGLSAIPYYRDTNPRFAAEARHTVNEVLAD